MKKILLVLLLVMTVLSFTSCEFLMDLFGIGGTVTISGTITLDSTAQTTGSPSVFVGLLDVAPADTSSVTWSTEVSENPQELTYGLEIPYTIEDVPEGKYVILAFVDVDGDNDYTEGEPFGSYPEYGTSFSLGTFENDFSSANITVTGSDTPVTPDALEVVSSLPDISTGVPQDAGISVTFNNALKADSVTSANFYIDYTYTTEGKTTTSIAIPGSLTLSTDKKTVTYVPDGGYLVGDLTYTVHCLTGIEDQNADTLDAEYAYSFTTVLPTLTEATSGTNYDFSDGLNGWSSHMGWSSSNLGNMSIYWENDGTDSYVVLNRANTSDGGRTMIAKDFGTGFPAGALQFDIEYRRVAQSLMGEQLTILVWYGDSSDPYANLWDSTSETAIDQAGDTDTGWVTALSVYKYLGGSGVYIGRIAVGSGGWEFTTYINSITAVSAGY